MVHGDAEEEQAVGVGWTACGVSDLEKAVDAGFADAEEAVEAEAVVAATLATVASIADDVAAVTAARFKERNDLSADGNALASSAGTATDAFDAVGVCDERIIR